MNKTKLQNTHITHMMKHLQEMRWLKYLINRFSKVNNNYTIDVCKFFTHSCVQILLRRCSNNINNSSSSSSSNCRSSSTSTSNKHNKKMAKERRSINSLNSDLIALLLLSRLYNLLILCQFNCSLYGDRQQYISTSNHSTSIYSIWVSFMLFCFCHCRFVLCDQCCWCCWISWIKHSTKFLEKSLRMNRV